MKSLSHYTETLQSELFKATGAFFAFNDEQLAASRAPGPIRYSSLGSGLIVPHINASALIDGVAAINAQGIAADIAENGLKGIIHRELGNHEAQITNSIEDTVDALADYPGITRETIRAEYREFFQHCVDNDYF